MVPGAGTSGPHVFSNGEYASDEGMSFAFSFHPRSQSPRKRFNFLTKNWRWARIGVAGGLYVLNGVVQCRCAVVLFLALGAIIWRWISCVGVGFACIGVGRWRWIWDSALRGGPQCQ